MTKEVNNEMEADITIAMLEDTVKELEAEHAQFERYALQAIRELKKKLIPTALVTDANGLTIFTCNYCDFVYYEAANYCAECGEKQTVYQPMTKEMN